MHRIIVGLIALVILASAAGAQDGGDFSGTRTRYFDGVLTVEASTPGSLRLTTTPGARTSGVVIRCGYYDIDGSTFDLFPVVPYPRQAPFILTCWQPTIRSNDPWVDPFPPFPILRHWTDPVPPQIVTDVEVAQYAANSIKFARPTPVLSPMTNQVVGVPTWLAVTSELSYGPVSAQAGNVWATVRPRFSHATWNLGNGDTVTCVADVATTWDPDVDPDAQSSDCAYTFDSNDEGEAFVGSVSVTWRVQFTSNETGPRGQALAPITLTTPVVFNVRELQAVIN